MKTLKEYIAIADFLGDAITEEQASRLLDEAKHDLSHADLETLGANVSGPLYTDLTEYYGETGTIPGYMGR